MNIKKKRILFVVGIMLLICCVFAGSYAFWTVTKEQNDTNNLVASCLDLELIEETGTFGVNNAWPISDEEGLELEGYSFKVKNNCNETVNYIIGIDSLSIEGAEYLDYSSIKVSLDNASPKVFGSLTDIERDNGRGSKQLEIKQIEGNETNSHNIKLWIKDTADVSEQSKQFKGQVFITGGQGISLPQKRIIATGDISETELDSVSYTLYSDGEIVISGTGNMMDFGKLDFSFDEDFSEAANYYEENGGLLANQDELAINIISKILLDYMINNYTGTATTSEQLEAFIAYSLYLSEKYVYEGYEENSIANLYAYDGATEPVSSGYVDVKNLLGHIPFITSIIVEEGITNIGRYAFANCNFEVDLPNTITSIRKRAFQFNTGIETLVIPDSVSSIETGIINSSNIKSLRLPANDQYTEIQYDFFSDSPILLEEIIIPENITSIYPGPKQATLKFIGPERTIYNNYGGALDLTPFNVVWNYTE